MKTKYIEVSMCCEALKERIQCNGWKGIINYYEPRILIGINIFSFCPFCGKKVKESKPHE